MYGVTIAELIEKMDFKNLTPELDSEKIIVSHPDVNRPALQLTGFYAHFDNERVQMIGNVEIAYLSGLSRERRIAMYHILRDGHQRVERGARILEHETNVRALGPSECESLLTNNNFIAFLTSFFT